jgi:hypothetical protein
MVTKTNNERLYVRAPLDNLPSTAMLQQLYQNTEDQATHVLHCLMASAQAINTTNQQDASKTGSKPNPSDYFSTKNIAPDVMRRSIPAALKRHNDMLNTPTAFVGFNIASTPRIHSDVSILTQRTTSLFKKTQNQRTAYVSTAALHEMHDCFLPLNDDTRHIAKLLAGNQGSIKEVVNQGFIFVTMDPALLAKLQQTSVDSSRIPTTHPIASS